MTYLNPSQTIPLETTILNLLDSVTKSALLSTVHVPELLDDRGQGVHERTSDLSQHSEITLDSCELDESRSSEYCLSSQDDAHL